ncbi:MAG: glycosyltransferase [Nitrosopumilus sp.]|nr:glycosyltransferase [Nitrosopumilus sp.]
MISLDGGYYWLPDISIWQILLVLFFPITFDYLRTFGKIIFLEIIKKRKKMLPVESYFRVHDKKISILIPAHNEESCIKESIESALDTIYPNKEIIVIDDGSTDNTYAIAKQYADKNLIKLVHLKRGGSKAAALNFGYLHSKGEIVITMDADTKLEKYALEKIVRRFDDQKVSALSGNIVPYGDDGITNILTKIQQNEYAVSFEIGKRFSAHLNVLLVISGAFAVFRRSALNWNGLFCTNTMTEDFDKSMQVQKIGKDIVFAEKSYASSFCPNNWKTWITQRTRWSHGHLQTLLKNKDVLLSSRYRTRFRLAVFDAWFADVILSFLYFIGIASLISLFITQQLLQDRIRNTEIPELGYLMFLLFGVYFVAEFVIFCYSRHNSDTPQPLQRIYLIPVMIFFYRPLLKIVVLRGYIKAILGKKVNW